MIWADFFAYVMLGFKALLFFVACVFLVSGFDEFVVDVVYFVRTVYRRLFVWSHFKHITEEELLNIAISGSTVPR